MLTECGFVSKEEEEEEEEEEKTPLHLHSAKPHIRPLPLVLSHVQLSGRSRTVMLDWPPAGSSTGGSALTLQQYTYN